MALKQIIQVVQDYRNGENKTITVTGIPKMVTEVSPVNYSSGGIWSIVLSDTYAGGEEKVLASGSFPATPTSQDMSPRNNVTLLKMEGDIFCRATLKLKCSGGLSGGHYRVVMGGSSSSSSGFEIPIGDRTYRNRFTSDTMSPGVATSTGVHMEIRPDDIIDISGVRLYLQNN